MISIPYVLESQIRFLDEKRTEPYKSTVKGVSQAKTGYDFENLGGVGSSADQQAKVVHRV